MNPGMHFLIYLRGSHCAKGASLTSVVTWMLSDVHSGQLKSVGYYIKQSSVISPQEPFSYLNSWEVHEWLMLQSLAHWWIQPFRSQQCPGCGWSAGTLYSSHKNSIIILCFWSILLTSVQSLSCVWLFVTPWTAVHQASLSITNSWSLLKLMFIELVMPSNCLILCCPLLLPSVLPSIRGFSSESVLRIRWPKD